MFSFVFMLIIGFFPFLYLLCTSLRYLKHPEKHTDAQRFRLVKKWIRVAEIHSFTKPTFHGLENIPAEEDGGFLVVPNHQGKYDALAVMHGFEYPVSVLMELHQSQKPGAKQVMDLIGGARIDLASPRQQLRIIRRMGERVRDGEKFIVFPEGGYTDNHNSIQKFHDGCLFAAFLARCPILPVLLVDTHESMNRNNIFHRARPHIYFLPPIPYEEYRDMSRAELAERLREILIAKMTEVLSARGEAYVPYEEEAPIPKAARAYMEN